MRIATLIIDEHSLAVYDSQDGRFVINLPVSGFTDSREKLFTVKAILEAQTDERSGCSG